MLERILSGRGIPQEAEEGEKVLDSYAVAEESQIANHLVRDIAWPQHCLLVAVKRGDKEIIPKGDTKIMMGDVIITMTDEKHNGAVYDAMSQLCRNNKL